MDIAKNLWEIYSGIDVSSFEKFREDAANANWFEYYKIDNLNSMRRWVICSNMKFPPKLYKDKLIIDMGCGWGLFSVLCVLQGAKKIYAIDCSTRRLDFIKEITAKQGEGHKIKAVNLFFDLGRDSIISDKVDVIIGNNFVEHLNDVQRAVFFRAAFNNLKHGGWLLLHTHNTDNKRFLCKLRQHWREADELFYSKMRKKIIEDNFSLNMNEVIELTYASYAMNRGSVLNICKEYLDKGTIPVPNYKLCALNPFNGIPDENYISPKAIKEEMKEAGFIAQIYPWLGLSRIGRVLYPYCHILPVYTYDRIINTITFRCYKE